MDLTEVKAPRINRLCRLHSDTFSCDGKPNNCSERCRDGKDLSPCDEGMVNLFVPPLMQLVITGTSPTSDISEHSLVTHKAITTGGGDAHAANPLNSCGLLTYVPAAAGKYDSLAIHRAYGFEDMSPDEICVVLELSALVRDKDVVEALARMYQALYRKMVVIDSPTGTMNPELKAMYGIFFACNHKQGDPGSVKRPYKQWLVKWLASLHKIVKDTTHTESGNTDLRSGNDKATRNGMIHTLRYTQAVLTLFDFFSDMENIMGIVNEIVINSPDLGTNLPANQMHAMYGYLFGKKGFKYKSIDNRIEKWRKECLTHIAYLKWFWMNKVDHILTESNEGNEHIRFHVEINDEMNRPEIAAVLQRIRNFEVRALNTYPTHPIQLLDPEQSI